MAFVRIDLETWKRRPQFDHYFAAVPCMYSMTVRLDITGVVRSGRKLYPTLLHALGTVVNRHEEFRTAMDGDGHVGVFDRLNPCYTVFHKDSETFSNIWTPFDENLDAFTAAYERDLLAYGAVESMNPKPDEPENTFPVSMIPWESFEGFHLNLQHGYAYLLPIFTFGRYVEENGRTLIPLAAQVHHAVCDGFHLCRFLSELRALLGQNAALPALEHRRTSGQGG